MKITKLTPEQEAKFSYYRDRWIKIGLDCSPIDHEKAEASVRLAYKQVNLVVPKSIVWVKSPLEGVKKVKEMGFDPLAEALYGQHEANWLSFYEFFKNECSSELNECNIDLSIIDGLIEVAQNAHWWWAFDEMAIICERPLYLCLDDQHRLHADPTKSHSIHYMDGWGFNNWHGVPIPDNWNKIENINIKEILKQHNQELRRCACEILGWEKVLQTLESQIIQKDDFGSLLEICGLNDGDKVARFCRVKDPSTNREYILRVPPTTRTCKEGIAATFKEREDTYNPISQS